MDLDTKNTKDPIGFLRVRAGDGSVGAEGGGGVSIRAQSSQVQAGLSTMDLPGSSGREQVTSEIPLVSQNILFLPHTLPSKQPAQPSSSVRRRPKHLLPPFDF